MQKTSFNLPPESAKFSVMHRVESDIVNLNQKIQRLEHQPGNNYQLLAAYRLMLTTRTDVLACLQQTLEH